MNTMLKVSAFSQDARAKAFMPFVNGFVNDRLLLGRRSVVPVSFNMLSDLFNARNFQPLVGNSLINHFAPQPFNSYRFLINIRSSSAKSPVYAQEWSTMEMTQAGSRLQRYS